MHWRRRLRLQILRKACCQVLEDLGDPEQIKDPYLCVLGLILTGLVQIVDHLLALSKEGPVNDPGDEGKP